MEHSKATHRPSPLKTYQAFTLLEVMIAIAIISVGFVTLLGSQAKSISIATETQFLLRATLLTNAKLAEFESGQRLFSNDNGTFENEVSSYSWEANIEEIALEIQDIPISESPKMIRLELSITLDETPYTQTVVSYHYVQNEEKE